MAGKKLEKAKEELAKYEAELVELNNVKIGRVKIGDDLSAFGRLFRVEDDGSTIEWRSNSEGFIKEVKQGRTFYDRVTAELFALREVTEFKIFCKFGDEVVILFNPNLGGCFHKGVYYTRTLEVDILNIDHLIDTLSPEELNSIRSE